MYNNKAAWSLVSLNNNMVICYTLAEKKNYGAQREI